LGEYSVFDVGRAAPATGGPARAPAWLRLLGRLPLLLLTLLPAIAGAQAQPAPTEASVRAAFVYQFGNYVEWPAAVLGEPGTPFVIAVLGDEEVLHELGQITSGRRIAGRQVEVRAATSADELGQAAVVYVGEDAAGQLPAIAERARVRPMLVVSASAVDLEQGGMIGFALSAGRLRFDVSLDALQASGLKVSSRLLAVARHVSGSPQ
jgi:hypothetical protein